MDAEHNAGKKQRSHRWNHARFKKTWPRWAFSIVGAVAARTNTACRSKSFWDGDEGVCIWQPQPYHQAWPGIVNGGILATLIDCHSACTATATACRAEHRPLNSLPVIPFVTASLRVSYLRPTPLDGPLTLRATVLERAERKMVLTCVLSAEGVACVRGEVVMVRLPA